MSSYYEKFLATGEVKCIDEEIPFEIPNGWEWCRLSELVSYQNGYAYTSSELNKEGKGLPVIKSGNLMTYEVLLKPNNDFVENPSDKMLASVIKKGDLLMCLSSQSDNPEPLGKTAIYKADNEALLNQRVLKMRPFVDEILEYLYYVINSEYFHYTVSHQGGGSAQANLKLNHVLSMLVPIAPLKEEIRIISELNNLLSLVNRYEAFYLEQSDLNIEIRDKLKKSILQEAIQGKLVPQIAEEGTAQELLEQIKLEKQRLVKEGKLKKTALNDSVIFKGDDNKYYEQIGSEVVDITDDIPFEIPINWMWIRLKDLCSIRTGATFKKEEASTENKGIRVLRGGNIQRFQLSTKPDDLFISEGKVKYDILLKQNDIVTPAVTSLENIGKMARVEIDMPDTTVGGFVFIIRPFWKNDYVSKYLLAFMSSPTTVDYMQSITNKSGQAFYNIGKERLATTLVPLPPLAEQERICCRISELFAEIRG